MAHPYHHALSSVHKWGGTVEDYIKIHNWFDQTKGYIPDGRHRAILHHSLGIMLCEQVFGNTITITNQQKKDGSENGNSYGGWITKTIPVRWVAEQHVLEDMGKIPTPNDFWELMPLQHWMIGKARRLSEEITEQEIPNELRQE